jgi:hypothetical protein
MTLTDALFAAALTLAGAWVLSLLIHAAARPPMEYFL